MDPRVCIPNIGPGERRRRRVLGVGALALASALLLVLLLMDAGPLARLWLIPFVLTGFLGLVQAREHT
jgi:hypothetical protein